MSIALALDESDKELLEVDEVPARRAIDGHAKRCLRSVAAATTCCVILAALVVMRFGGVSLSHLGRAVQDLWSMRDVSPDNIPATKAECFFDTTIAPTYLARAGLEINAATESCAEADGEGHGSESNGGRARNPTTVYHHSIGHHHSKGRHLRKRDSSRQARLARAQAARERADAANRRAQVVLRRVRELQHRKAPGNRTADFRDSQHQHAREMLGAARSAKHELERGHGELTERLEEMKQTIARRACSAQVTGATASFGFVAAFLSAATSECALRYENEAYCSSDIAKLFASLAEVVSAASAVAGTCTDEARIVDNFENGDESANEDFDRRLAVLPASPRDRVTSELDGLLHDHGNAGDAEKQERKARQAECAIDVTTSVLFVGRAGMEINGAVEHCNKPGKAHHLRCGATAAGAFSAIAMLSYMLSNTAVECQETLVTNLDAGCSSAISQLLGSTSELGAAGAGLVHSCNESLVYDDVDVPALDI